MKKPLLLGITFVLVLMRCSDLVPTAGGSTTSDNAKVMAIVYNTKGSPAAGAMVRLRRSDYVTKPIGLAKLTIDSAETLTDAQGRFEFNGIDSGVYHVEINDRASSSVMLACTLSHADTADLGVATLRPYAAMRGTIDTAGRGDRRIYVQVQGLERIAEIDANGSFTFNDLPAGVFNLHIRALDTVTYPERPLHGIPVVSGDTARVTTMLPAPWQSTGIGETPRGSAALVNDQFVVAGGGFRDGLESAIRQVVRALEVRILADLVLQISEERDGVRLQSLNLIRSGLLGLPQGGGGVGGLGVDAAFAPLLTRGLRLAWLAGDVAHHCQHGRFACGCVRPGIVVGPWILCLGASCRCQHRDGRSHEHCHTDPALDRLHADLPLRFGLGILGWACGWGKLPNQFLVSIEDFACMSNA